MMKKLLFILLIFFACGSIPPTNYYTLDYPLPEANVEQQDVALYIPRFRAQTIYQKDNLIYKNEPYQYSFDPYRCWIDVPANLLTQKACEYFRALDMFDKVSTSLPRQPHYTLAATIISFEEVVENSTRSASFGLWIEIVDPGEQLLWSGKLEKQQIISSRPKNWFIVSLRRLQSNSPSFANSS